MLTFPLECLVCRQVTTIEKINIDLFALLKVTEIVCTEWINLSSDRSHYIITFLIVLASVILSLSTDCLGIVLELNVSYFYYYFFLLKY